MTFASARVVSLRDFHDRRIEARLSGLSRCSSPSFGACAKWDSSDREGELRSVAFRGRLREAKLSG